MALTLNNLLQFLFRSFFSNLILPYPQGMEQQEEQKLIETFSSTRFYSHGRRRQTKEHYFGKGNEKIS